MFLYPRHDAAVRLEEQRREWMSQYDNSDWSVNNHMYTWPMMGGCWDLLLTLNYCYYSLINIIHWLMHDVCKKNGWDHTIQSVVKILSCLIIERVNLRRERGQSSELLQQISFLTMNAANCSLINAGLLSETIMLGWPWVVKTWCRRLIVACDIILDFNTSNHLECVSTIIRKVLIPKHQWPEWMCNWHHRCSGHSHRWRVDLAGSF